MKKQTLAPAVLASITAVGLVLAPVAASAQESDEQNTSLSDAAADTSTKTSTDEETDPPAETAPPEVSSDTNDSSDGDEGQDAGGDGATAEDPDDAPATPAEDPESGDTEGPANEDEGDGDEEDGDEDTVQPELSITPGTVPLSEIVHVAGENAPDGVTIAASDLEEGEEYTLRITGGPEPEVTETLTASAPEYVHTIAVDADTDLSSYAGTRSVELTSADGTSVANGTLTIEDDTEGDDDSGDEDGQGDDEAPAFDPSLDVPESIAVDDVMVPEGEEPGDRGLQITAGGLTPGDSYTFRIVAPEDTPDLAADFVAEADENGNASGVYFIEWVGDYNADMIAGLFGVQLLGADDVVLDSADVEFTSGSDDGGNDDGEDSDDGSDDGEDSGDRDDDKGQPGEDDSDDADVDPSVTVSPQELSAASFMDYDRGVQVAASGCLPGDSVSLEVYWPGTDDVAYADGIEADDNGSAAFSFYGTGSNASDYVGTWKVAITCSGETVTDTFTVTGSKDDDGRSGSDLPRTGSDAGILAIVATSLLTVGAATVMVSSRPKRRDTL